MTTVADRAHATDYAEHDAAAARHRERFKNSYRVLEAIGRQIRALPWSSLDEDFPALELAADAIYDLMDADRDLPEDVADVLVGGFI
jgi:hypothetical protein